MKIKAFTLAEILITLAIIGIVSALTIPTLMADYQNRVFVTTLHKTYNDINQALQRFMSDKNTEDLMEAGMRNQASVNSFIENYLKYNKVCSSTMSGCMAATTDYYKMSNANIPSSTFANTQSYILASGATIRPYYYKSGDKLINFLVDTNGVKKPNTLGRDLFILGVYRNGLIDDYKDADSKAPMSSADRESVYNSQCLGGSNTSIWGCFGKILNDNWQMKY